MFLLDLFLHPVSSVLSLLQLGCLLLVLWAVVDVVVRRKHMMGSFQRWLWIGLFVGAWLLSGGYLGGLLAVAYLFFYRKTLHEKPSPTEATSRR